MLEYFSNDGEARATQKRSPARASIQRGFSTLQSQRCHPKPCKGITGICGAQFSAGRSHPRGVLRATGRRQGN